jgi:hypothetical protein
MGGSLMQAVSSLLPSLDRVALLRALSYGSLWGVIVAAGFIALSYHRCGVVDLYEAFDTLSLSLLAGIVTIGPVTWVGRIP